MTSRLPARFKHHWLNLAVTAGMLVAVACGGDAGSPPSSAVLATVPTSASAGAEAPASVEETGAAPEPVSGVNPGPPLVEPPGGPTGPRPEQAATSDAYWPGWSGIDCGSYTRRPVAFCEAMKDAEVAEPSEIHTDLIPVVAHNEELIWSGTRGESRLLVLTWSSFIDRTSSGSDYSPANGFRVGEAIVSARDVFVTVAPELKEFCQAQGPLADPALRLEQLLGLAPNDGKDSRGNHRAFVELWVDPQHLFRPAPDPEITDREAGLDFPASGRFVTVSEDHVQWFNHFRSMSYEETGLPWTRLGYTYDWGDPDSDVGLSEFVIQRGATVEPYSITPTEEYC